MTVFLPIVPNWQNGVRDTYEFKTDVFTTDNGKEQRRSLRMQPRRSVDAAVLLDGDRLRVFSDALTRAKNGKIEIADFSADAAVTTATVEAGQSVLPVDHMPAWIGGAMTCVLLTGRTARKVLIDTIGSGNVLLETPLAEAVGQGAKLLPLLPASLGNSNTLSIYTTMLATSALHFDVEPGTIVREPDPLPFDGGPTGETTQVFGPAGLFYGRYVLLRKPNYLQQPQVAFNLPFQRVDYDRGVVATFTPVPFISRTLTATHMAMSHAEAMSLLDIFVRCRGRAGEIYAPTWGSDFPKVKSVVGTQITVEGRDFYDTYAAETAHRAFLIRLKNGDIKPREIRSMILSGSDTVIECDLAIGSTVADIDFISWMFVARFAQDALTIEWRTDGLTNISFSFVTLENLAVENAYGSNWILASGYWRDAGQWEDTATWNDA